MATTSPADKKVPDLASVPTEPVTIANENGCTCLSNNLAWLLGQANHAFGSHIAAALEPLGLGSRGYCVLSAALEGEFTQTQLAQLIGIDKTMMMVTLDDLEKKGFAERRRSATDRRAHVIHVTDAGRVKVDEAQVVNERVQAEVLAALPENVREGLLGGLLGLVSGRLAEPAMCSTPVRRREPRP